MHKIIYNMITMLIYVYKYKLVVCRPIYRVPSSTQNFRGLKYLDKETLDMNIYMCLTVVRM